MIPFGRMRSGAWQRLAAFTMIAMTMYTLWQWLELESTNMNSYGECEGWPRPMSKSMQEERFLAYLPHSGLSNQRIELANALLLATMLKRTLIVPPAMLGEVPGWQKREVLEEKLTLLTSPNNLPTLCDERAPGKLGSYIVNSRCSAYQKFGVMRWSDLHDLSSLDSVIKMRFFPTISLGALQDSLGITDDDTYIYEDQKLYDWRLYEDEEEAQMLIRERLNYFDSFAGRVFFKVFTPKQWQCRPERLLYLGGVFSSNRLTVHSPLYMDMRERIAAALKLRRDTPLGTTAHAIVEYFGGQGTYEAVHLRAGDSPFRRMLPKNIANLSANMTERLGEQGCEAGQIYMATDQKNPRGEKSPLRPWFQKFPCTWTLDDVPPELLAPLDEIRDFIHPSKPLRKFMIPLIDAMIAAHGKGILTTPRSTYSKYIGQLQEAWSNTKN